MHRGIWSLKIILKHIQNQLNKTQYNSIISQIAGWIVVRGLTHFLIFDHWQLQSLILPLSPCPVYRQANHDFKNPLSPLSTPGELQTTQTLDTGRNFHSRLAFYPVKIKSSHHHFHYALDLMGESAPVLLFQELFLW